MASNRDTSGANDGTSGLTRRDLLRWGATAGGIALAGSGIGQALAADGKKTLTIGNIGWSEDVALAHLTRFVLERELGYSDIKIVKRGAGELFKGVADGSIDTFQDVWLPHTHKKYWQKYGDKVKRLPPWYEGMATLGLTVPDYVEAQSITDLPAYRSEFGGKIIGIEPSAGEMRIVKNKVIPGYNLSGYTLVPGTTPKMLDQLGQAIQQTQPIVVTLYKPNWAFTVYNLRYLKDPKGLISGLRDRIYTIVGQNLSQKDPVAYAFLKAIRLSPHQLGNLELKIQAADSPEEGVEDWLSGGKAGFGARTTQVQRLVQSWVEAAMQARS